MRCDVLDHKVHQNQAYVLQFYAISEIEIIDFLNDQFMVFYFQPHESDYLALEIARTIDH